MSPVLKDTYNYFENFTGKRLLVLVVSLFVSFLVVGLLLGQLQAIIKGKKGNTSVVVPENKGTTAGVVEKSGRVVYSDPALHPDDKISYKLIDASGKDIILLKASDDKLKVIEGGFVKVRGKLKKTLDGKFDVLIVEQVVFN